MNQLISPHEYKLALDFYYDFFGSQGDYRTLVIKEKILPTLASCNALLDVGAGQADFTSSLAEYFKSITVIDSNPIFEDIYIKKNFKYFIGDFLQFNTLHAFDFVTCSHVLYYFPDRLDEVLQILLTFLNPKGILMVVLVAPRGASHKLHSKLNPNYVHSGKVEASLDNLNCSYTKFEHKINILTKELAKIQALCKLFLSVDCFSNKMDSLTGNQLDVINAELHNYFKTNKKGSDYCYEQEEDLFIIANKR